MPRLVILLSTLSLIGLDALPAQTTGTIAGSITGNRPGTKERIPLAGVTLRAKNLATGVARETRTASDGTYKFALPAGTYDVFATAVGYSNSTKRAVIIKPGTPAAFDASLTASLNEGTPGEIVYLHFRDESTPPRGPAPRTRDGHPDLSGVWYPGLDVEPEDVPFLPWSAEYARTHTVADDPRSQCLPSGVARGQQMELAKLIQTPTEVVMLMEGAPPGFRQIFLDGRAHPKNLDPSWMGHSIGHWEKDSLVVDTVGFNDRAWIDFNRTPQTEKLHITERFRRLDLGHLDLVITIDDPGAYSRPWKMHRILTLAAGEEVQEYVCNENNVTQHYMH